MEGRAAAFERLVWLDIPEGMETDIGPFTLDPSIALPIERGGESDDFDFRIPCWDDVIAAVLLLLIHRPSHEHADYYRDFVLALEPDMVDDLADTAEECCFLKDWEGAEDTVLAVLGLAPRSEQARWTAARFYDMRSEWERRGGDNRAAEDYAAAAEAGYGELLSDEGAPRDAWYDAGLFRYRRGDFARALDAAEFYLDDTRESAGGDEYLNEARRIVRMCRDEGQADKTYLEARAAFMSGRTDEGMRLAGEFRESRPGGWAGWRLLGWGYRLKEDWEAARGALENARERGCTESALYSELAMCSRALGDYDAAIEALANVLRLDPENTDAVAGMGLVMMEKGDRAEALRWMRCALVLRPGNRVFERFIADWEGGAAEG